MPFAAQEVTEVRIPYLPRPEQKRLHAALKSHRFVVSVTHRRLGKTVAAVNELIKRALMCQRDRPRFAYIAPTYRMGKATAWDFLKYFSRPIPGVTFNESELRADYPNGGQVRIYGGDDPDNLRGLYLDGAVFDEFGLHQSDIFTTVIRPALADRDGWALFLGTPNGKNQFYDIAQFAQSGQKDWTFLTMPVSETKLLPAVELEAARAVMTADEYQQEFECSFEASVKGAIYAAELALARASGRMTRVPCDPLLSVDTVWDLGVGDSTAIWFSQSLRSGELRVIDYYEASGEGLPHYVGVLKAKGYTYGRHTAPHDIQVKEFASGRSRLEAAASLGLTFAIAPNIPIEDGIHAARMLFPLCWFDADKCKAGIEALQHYKRDYNARLNEFKATPVHDWACVTGDTKVLTRYGACQIQYLPQTGEVLTPCGWKAYEQPMVTRKNAPLVAVAFSDGTTVRCTPDHLFLTVNGWKYASDLRTDSLIQSCWTPSRFTSMVGSIGSGLQSGIGRVVAFVSTALSGAWPLDLFQKVATSTIATTTLAITTSPISNASMGQNISLTNGIARNQASANTSPPALDLPQLNGMVQRPVASGTAAMPNGPRVGRNGRARIVLASIAALSSKWSSVRERISKSIALKRAKPLRIESVTVLSGTADVWCLTVPDGHMWPLENGAMVHNSHGADAWRYLAVTHRTPRDKRAAGRAIPQPQRDGWAV